MVLFVYRFLNILIKNQEKLVTSIKSDVETFVIGFTQLHCPCFC